MQQWVPRQVLSRPNGGRPVLHLTSDKGRFQLRAGPGDVDSLGHGTGMLIRDLLHLLLSGIASSNVESPLLRMALAVTDIMLEVPSMHPLNAIPAARSALLKAWDMSFVLQFLVQRGFVLFSLQSETGQVVDMSPAPLQEEAVYQSADFGCHYLDRFLSDGFLKRGRMIHVYVTQLPGDTLDSETYRWMGATEGNSTVYYDRKKVAAALLGQDTWTQVDVTLTEIFRGIFSDSDSSSSNAAGTQKEDDVSATGEATSGTTKDTVKTVYASEESPEYCEVWRRMMEDIKDDKRTRMVRSMDVRVTMLCCAVCRSSH